ncbi:hypothetical protein KIN20_010451 [Parelaphostrongylus tenuis]|uniref:Uncharacterized protein n=1 Tax=Parelaphostrongylus tenuis TaxID=148309 RepID=A0AAD5M7W6_PARTN|nr:hypothetical protein KIN20_010451 [Parelaphostrongylus tenuis]
MPATRIPDSTQSQLTTNTQEHRENCSVDIFAPILKAIVTVNEHFTSFETQSRPNQLLSPGQRRDSTSRRNRFAKGYAHHHLRPNWAQLLRLAASRRDDERLALLCEHLDPGKTHF